MTREQWTAAYRQARAKGNTFRDYVIPIDGQYWTILNFHDRGRMLHNSYIHDRAPQQRIAEELFWSAKYRLQARKIGRDSFYSNLAASHKRGARACIDDCRRIRESASAFHALP